MHDEAGPVGMLSLTGAADVARATHHLVTGDADAAAQREDGRRRSAAGGRAELACLIAIIAMVGVCIGGPAFAIAGSIALRVPSGPSSVSVELIARSLAVSVATALGIGIAATLLGWPLASLLSTGGRHRRLLAPLLLTPLFVPQTLAYAGWGVVRSPDTVVGDWVVGVAQSGQRWLPVVLDRSLAVAGLALWAAPLAAAVLAVWLSRTPALVIFTNLQFVRISSIVRDPV